MGKTRLIGSTCLSLGLVYCLLLTGVLIGALAVLKYADWQGVDITLRPRASRGVWMALIVWVLRSWASVWILGWAGISHHLSPGHPFSLGIRMTTCLGFTFSEKVSCSGEPALSGSELEKWQGWCWKGQTALQGEPNDQSREMRSLEGVGHRL